MNNNQPIIIDRKKALISLDSNPVSFRNFGKHLRNDKELVFKAVSLNCFNFGYASNDIKDACIGNDPIVILHKLIFNNKLNETLSNKNFQRRIKI